MSNLKDWATATAVDGEEEPDCPLAYDSDARAESLEGYLSDETLDTAAATLRALIRGRGVL
jgi:hypothetical protein